MKFLSKLITVKLPDELLEWIDEMIQKRGFANRTEVITEAVASLIVGEKSEIRASPKKKTPFKDYVKEIKKNIGRVKI